MGSKYHSKYQRALTVNMARFNKQAYPIRRFFCRQYITILPRTRSIDHSSVHSVPEAVSNTEISLAHNIGNFKPNSDVRYHIGRHTHPYDEMENISWKDHVQNA